MAHYLEENGLTYLWSKIKTLVGSKVDKVDGKGLSTNDYTTTEKNKLAGLSNYTLPTASASTKGGIKVGAGLSISSDVLKADVTTTVLNEAKSEVLDLANDYTDTKVRNIYTYKGSVATASNLPTSGQTAGDVYDIIAASTYGPAGTNVAWTGTEWDALGGSFDIVAITNAEIDTICK